MSDELLRRSILKDPIVYFKEWAEIGDHPKNDAWRRLQRRVLGDHCRIIGNGWQLVKVSHAET